MKKYEYYLLDADGTLFDYDLAEESALKSMFLKHQFSYDDSVRTQYRKINQAAWDAFEKGLISKSKLQLSRFEQLFDFLGITESATAFSEAYLVELGKGIFLIDGALALCQSLFEKGKKVYIVTNGMITTQRMRLKKSMIKPYILDMFVSEEIGFQKPNPLYFEYVFSHIAGFDKQKALIVGDSLSADILGGNNSGIDSCWFNRNNEENTTGITPAYVINNLNELHKLI